MSNTETATPAIEEQLYYLRDTRTTVGNCVMWWALDSRGYTTELGKAEKFTREQAFEPGRRKTDVPVPCNLAERIAVQHVRAERLGDVMEQWLTTHPEDRR